MLLQFNNFEALVWLGLILALFVMYVQRRHPIGGLDWFVMPMAILLLIGAAIFGRTEPRNLSSDGMVMGSSGLFIRRSGLFVVAGAVVCDVPLVANRRLRNKVMVYGAKLGSLERLEEVTLAAVTLGFALLTVGRGDGFIWFTVTSPDLGMEGFIDRQRLVDLCVRPSFADQPAVQRSPSGDPEHRRMC